MDPLTAGVELVIVERSGSGGSPYFARNVFCCCINDAMLFAERITVVPSTCTAVGIMFVHGPALV